MKSVCRGPRRGQGCIHRRQRVSKASNPARQICEKCGALVAEFDRFPADAALILPALPLAGAA